MTKTSLSSDKNVPLPPSLIPRYYPDRYSFLVTCIWTIDTSWISQQADQEWDKKWSSRAETTTYHKDSGFFRTRTFYSTVLLLHNKGSLTCWINRTCFFENVLKFVGFQTMLMLDLYCMTYTECMVWYDLNNAEVCSLHSETCLYIQIQLRMLWFCIYFFMEKKSCFPFHYHFANSHENIYITRVVRPSHTIL